MHKQLRKFAFSLITLAFPVIAVGVLPVLAQTTDFGVAYGVIIEDQPLQDGQLVSLVNGRYQLSRTEYDRDMIGVVDLSPDLLLDFTGDSQSVPIVATGQVYVLVGNQQGDIEAGDWITSSQTPGIGMRADRDLGPVIGQALEAFPANAGQPGLVLVMLSRNQGIGGRDDETPSFMDVLNRMLIELLNLSQDTAEARIFDLIRYILAAIVIIISIVFAYMTFGKVARSGVEAVGRNPLAKTSILTGVLFNISIGAVIILSGVGVAYLIIKL
jgi:F0F1-type ATP synthase membrane subunit c/vacuolar-type H+-ATPase subunit K